MAKFKPPEISWTAQDLHHEWRRFSRQAECIFDGPLHEKEESVKVRYLKLWVGDKGLDVFEGFTFAKPEDVVKLKVVLKKFEEYCMPQKNHIMAALKFNERCQGDNESFDSFVTDLKILVKDCGSQEEKRMVRDATIFCCKHPKVREKYLDQADALTCEKAIEIGRNYETNLSSLKKLASDEDPTVNTLSQEKRLPWNRRQRSNKSKGKTEKTTKANYVESKHKCRRCGYDKAHKKCPAMGQQCRHCKKMNHFSKLCLSKEVHQLQEVADSNQETEGDSDEEECEDNLLLIYSVKSSCVPEDEQFHEVLVVDDTEVRFQLDSGAKTNVMSLTTYNNLRRGPPLTKKNTVLISFSKHRLKPCGEVVLSTKYKDNVEDVKFFVVEAEVESVVSGNICVKLGLLKRVRQLTSNTPLASTTVELDDYPELFNGLGCLPGTYRIELAEGATPVVHSPRKIPVPQREKVVEELKRMEKLGVIVHQEEPKPNGSVRLCIDPRDLNAAMKRSHYPMKTVDEVASRLQGANTFSILDAKSGFWQLKLDEESSLLCTFNTPLGRYGFTRLPFGVKCAPEIFQRTMDQMVEDLDGVEVIMEDIIISGDETTHDERLMKFLERASKKGGKCLM